MLLEWVPSLLNGLLQVEGGGGPSDNVWYLLFTAILGAATGIGGIALAELRHSRNRAEGQVDTTLPAITKSAELLTEVSTNNKETRGFLAEFVSALGRIDSSIKELVEGVRANRERMDTLSRDVSQRLDVLARDLDELQQGLDPDGSKPTSSRRR